MKIISFDNQFLDTSAKIFVEEFSEEKRQWNLETAKAYLKNDTANFPEYCFAALDDNNEYMGGVFCKIDPYYQDNFLLVDVLLIVKESRKKGVAKALLTKIKEIAESNNISGIHLLADGREGYPKNWYEKMGFKTTGWVEYEVNLSDMKI